MTDEERKTIERCKQIIKDNNEIIKEARKNRDINTMQLTASIDNDSIAIETVLNLIQKQQEEIRQYEKALHDQIIEDYDMEIKLKDELEKKDKIIDLMADNIYEDDSNLGYYLCRKNGKCTKEIIIEYFKRKVEGE